MTTLDIMFVPVTGLVATYEVQNTDGTVLAVICETLSGWHVISTRYGAAEPKPGPHPSRWAAVTSLGENHG